MDMTNTFRLDTARSGAGLATGGMRWPSQQSLGTNSGNEQESKEIIDMFESSKDTKRMLQQLDQRQSIINQGDIYIQRRNQREALRLAAIDGQGTLPAQIWYD